MAAYKVKSAFVLDGVYYKTSDIIGDDKITSLSAPKRKIFMKMVKEIEVPTVESKEVDTVIDVDNGEDTEELEEL